MCILEIIPGLVLECNGRNNENTVFSTSIVIALMLIISGLGSLTGGGLAASRQAAGFLYHVQR